MPGSQWTREGLAWAAGLFEGEGSIICRRQCVKGRDYDQWSLTLASTDLDIIERIHKIIGFGHITGPYHPKGSTKPVWNWRITKASHTYAVLVALYPWLGERRRARAQECLEALGSKPVKRCDRGHLWRPASVKVRPIDGRATRVCLECLDEGHLSSRRVG